MDTTPEDQTAIADVPMDVAAFRLQRELDEEARWQSIAEKQARWLKTCVRRGTLLFVGVEFLFVPLSLWRLPVAIVVGALVGFSWFRLRTSQLTTLVLAMTASTLHQLIWLNTTAGSPLGVVFAPFFIGAASAWLGMRADMRAYEV